MERRNTGVRSSPGFILLGPLSSSVSRVVNLATPEEDASLKDVCCRSRHQPGPAIAISTGVAASSSDYSGSACEELEGGGQESAGRGGAGYPPEGRPISAGQSSLPVDAAYERDRRKIEGAQTTSNSGSRASYAYGQPNIEVRTDGQIIEVEECMARDSLLGRQRPVGPTSDEEFYPIENYELGERHVLLSCQDTIKEAKKRRKQKRKQEIEGGAGTSKAATNDFFSDPRKYAQGSKLGWLSPGAFT